MKAQSTGKSGSRNSSRACPGLPKQQLEFLLPNKRAGQSLIEILMGVALMAMGISFATILIYGGQNVLIDRGNSLEARSLAEEGLDAARSIGARSWANLTNGTYGLNFANNKWSFSSGADYRNIFTRKVTVSDIGQDEKQIASDVTWSANAKLGEVKFVTILTNWKNAIAPPDPGDTGGTGIAGDWQNPITLGSVDLGAGESATDLDVESKIVYMTAQASSQAKPDFFIVDATDGQHPFIASSLDTGPGLLSLDASTNYAYAGNNNTSGQLQVINISNKNSPVLTKSFTLSGVSGSGAVGNTVFYANSKIYVGTKKATGPEFHVIDVSNPASPSELGSLEINANVNAIYVSGNVAYLATSDTQELKVLDVSNPGSMTQIGFFDAPGESEDGKAIDLVGTKLYLGRLVGGNHPNHHEFHIIDVSSSTSPQNLGSVDLATDLNDLKVRDNLAFLATSDPNKEFQIWDISNPSNITMYSSFNFPQVATGIDYENNIIYVSVRSNDGLRIITSQ